MRDQELIKKIAVRMSENMSETFTEEDVEKMLEARGESAEERWRIMGDCEEMARNWKPGTKPTPSPGDPDYDLYLRQTVPYEYGHILNPKDEGR